MHTSNIKFNNKKKNQNMFDANILLLGCETYNCYHCRIQNDCPGEYTKALLQPDAEVLGKEFCKAMSLSGACEKNPNNQSETEIVVKL